MVYGKYYNNSPKIIIYKSTAYEFAAPAVKCCIFFSIYMLFLSEPSLKGASTEYKYVQSVNLTLTSEVSSE